MGQYPSAKLDTWFDFGAHPGAWDKSVRRGYACNARYVRKGGRAQQVDATLYS